MDCPRHHIREISEDLGSGLQAEGKAPVNKRIPSPLDPEKMTILRVDRDHSISILKVHLDEFRAWTQAADNLYCIVHRSVNH